MKLTTVKGGFAEIYRDGLRFSFMKWVAEDTFEAYHGSTCCKDFFTDIFWAERMKAPTSIHGFTWTPGTVALDQPYYYMALEHSTAFDAARAALLQDFLNFFEAAYKFPYSQVEAVDGKLLIAFPNAWTQRPVLVSMVTGLMRIGLAYEGRSPAGGIDFEAFFKRLLAEGNPFGQYDASEFGKEKVVPTILESLDTGIPPHPAQTFEQYTSPYQCHHSGGLIAFTTGRATG